MGSKKQGGDALGSLLSDLTLDNVGSIEGNVFSRPKTLSDMRQKGSSTKTPVNLSGSSPSKPSSKPVNNVNQAPEPKSSTGVTADDLDAVFGAFTTSRPQPAAAQSPIPPSTSQDPFLDVGMPSSSSVPSSLDDPMRDVFGNVGPPPSSSNGDGFDAFDAFGDNSFQQQQQQPTASDINDDMFGVFSMPTNRAQPAAADTHIDDDYSSNDINTTDHHHHLDTNSGGGLSASSSQIPSREPSSSFIERLDSGGNNSSGARKSHKVFDYLDAQPAAGRTDHHHTSTAPSPLHAAPPPARSQQHGSSIVPERTQEAVAEVAHKAAKMLSTGGKWFAKASKNLAREVQARLDKHQLGIGVGTSTGANTATTSTGASTAAGAYYYDWAAQLSRISPGSRAAALGAMSEDDRLAVQRIMDEAELGERFQSDQYQDDDPPPPAYDQVVVEPKPAPPRERVEKPAAAAPVKQEADVDFLGMDQEEDSIAPPPSSASTVDIADMFTVSDTTNARAPSNNKRPAVTKTKSSRGNNGLESMIDLGEEPLDVDTSNFNELYDDGEEQGEANEPEIRRVLREKRIREKHERMMRQLAEKRARDEADEAQRSGKVELREQLKPKIDAWMAGGKKDNIRALLSSLHTVLWENSGWTQPSMADMVDNNKVKRIYMKANLIVHPDKVKQKGGTLEQITVADMVFDVLKGAWGKFEDSNK